MRKISFKKVFAIIINAALIAAWAVPTIAFGHGFEGDRFFPPTPTTDDPFAVDELSFPTISVFRNPASDDGPNTREIDIGYEFDKEILPHLSIGISQEYVNLRPVGGPTTDGFSNIELNLKYQLWESPKHEAVLSLGGTWDIGGSGSNRIGVDYFSTFTPTIYFGKGFGDLPDAVRYLKPFALTGTLAETLPTNSQAPNAFQLGLAFEYSFPYLQEHVEDIGIPKLFRNMIPLVEFNLNTPTKRGAPSSTGTVNPGVLWESKYFQIGVEALIPMNVETGSSVGGIFQVQIFIDDIFPKVFGHPLFCGGDK